MTQITSDDGGKKVVSQNGDTIGMVSGVESGRVHVDPDPGITEKVKSRLGWMEVEDDDYSIDESAIDAVRNNKIRLSR